MDAQRLILRNVLTDEKYMRKVVPFLKVSYFSGISKTVFRSICKYVEKYNQLPTQDVLAIELQKDDRITSEGLITANEMLPEIFQKESVDSQWLYDTTEEWCKKQAVHNAILDAVAIIEGKNTKYNTTAIPSLLQEALSVGFDANIGHDYIDDAAARFEYYSEDLERIPFDLDYLNRITKGGLVRKTLNVLMAGTGVGKTLAMCHVAAGMLSQGRNVLYITNEMAEEKIAERIDANLLDIPLDQLQDTPVDMFMDRVNRLKKAGAGKLIIKEYPTASANANHYRALLNDLRMKKNFVPDLIVVDYLNICASSRLKAMGGSINSYSYIKAIAEEIRGLAVEFDVPILTATQTTRGGFANSDPGLEDTSESFGLPATADLMLAIISTDDLEKDGLVMFKQLKNRYNDINKHKRFVVGIERDYMRLHDVEQQRQEEVADEPVQKFSREEKPVMDMGDIIF